MALREPRCTRQFGSSKDRQERVLRYRERSRTSASTWKGAARLELLVFVAAAQLRCFSTKEESAGMAVSAPRHNNMSSSNMLHQHQCPVSPLHQGVLQGICHWACHQNGACTRDGVSLAFQQIVAKAKTFASAVATFLHLSPQPHLLGPSAQSLGMYAWSRLSVEEGKVNQKASSCTPSPTEKQEVSQQIKPQAAASSD